jgi:primosomal protein N' (replication factor Y) (superfamily II helicase)
VGGDAQGRRPEAGARAVDPGTPPPVRVVRVLPDVAAVGRSFDYEVPADAGPLPVGTRVRVPLHGRRVAGWVVADDVAAEPGRALLAVLKVSGLGPPPPVVALAEWAAWRWAGPKSALLTAASPPRMVSSLPAAPPAVARLGAGADPVGEAARAAIAGDDGRPSLLRVGPATDLLGVVVAVCASVRAPVLVLVPSTGWAERLGDRLARRGLAVARGWEEEAAGWPVVVGARGAAFSPAGRLGAAVVLDAHDEAYREERSPQFDAAAVVAERCRRDGAPCLFTSATPTAQLVHATRAVELPRDRERAGWSRLVVVDRRAADPRTGLYSEELVQAARRSMGGRTVVVYNRRGRGRVLACARCGELARCTRCGRVVAERGEGLACPVCGTERPRVCAACGGMRLKLLRVGVSRVREELEALLGSPVGEVTAAADEVPDTDVVVGTEAVLHRVRRAALVAFLDFDLHLLAPRLAAGEQALALLARAGRLVGGRSSAGGGSVLVQTRLPDHEVLRAATAGDPSGFLAGELALREELALPPFRALAELSGPGAAEFFALLGLEGSATGEDRFVVRAPDHERLCDALAGTPRPKARVAVVVDPAGV